MNKSRVPILWASRLISGNSISSSSSPSLFRHSPCNQTRHFMGVSPLTEMLEKYSAKNKGFVETANPGKFEERPAVVDCATPTEKELLSMYTQGGQLVRNAGILPCGNYNGALDFTKVKGPAVSIPLPKAYETCFQNRMIHNLVERAKQSDDKPVGKWASYSSASGTAEQKTSANQESGAQAHVLRPLSPHLPIYKPHINSTMSILNRISGSFLTLVVTSFYLIYLKLGPVCLSFENFYQFLFYSSKLTLITLEMTALALAYHVYAGVRHLLMDFSGNLIGKAGKEH